MRRRRPPVTSESPRDEHLRHVSPGVPLYRYRVSLTLLACVVPATAGGPPDPARVKLAASMLPKTPRGVGRPIGDRGGLGRGGEVRLGQGRDPPGRGASVRTHPRGDRRVVPGVLAQRESLPLRARDLARATIA